MFVPVSNVRKLKDEPFLLRITLRNTTTSTRINSVMTHPHKFLGSVITSTCSPEECFTQMKLKLEEKLNNIDNAKVRGEYKLAIYEQCALLSMHYHLSIYNIHTMYLKKIL